MVLYVYSLKSSCYSVEVTQYIEEELKKIYRDIVCISFNEFKESSLNGISHIIFSGGDGTFHNLINIVKDKDIVLGYIPLGTANDMGRNLGIKNYKIAIDVLKKNHIKEYNLIEIEDDKHKEYVNYALCFGNMAKVSNNALKKNKKRLHKFDYLLRGCRYLLCKRSEVFVIINNKEYRKKVRALIIYRTKTLGGYKITNKTTDLLMVTFIRNIFDLGFMFILHHPKIIYTDSIKINTNAISSLDGEQGDFSNCMVRISDKKIKIYANN